MRRFLLVLGLAGGIALASSLLVDPALAQSLTFDLGDNSGSTTARMVQMLALLTVLSLAPSILVMVTSFTRIVVVLSFLRTALGIQSTPPSSVIISLALFLTAFVMAPTLEQAFNTGIRPLINEEISETEALNRTIVPFHKFMMQHVRDRDLKLFLDLSRAPVPETPEATPLRALVPGFMISELRRAFEIGFLIFVPFLIIDMVVASVLLSMGMMMLPPAVVSLPFKLIFFVLVDGWFLVAGSLVQSFGT
jgi:flagellar biosynthetic protein FliP